MNFIRLLFLCFIFMFPISTNVRANFFNPDLKTAQEAYKKNDFKTAFKHWKALEEYDYNAAYLGLGKLYARGLGIDQNHKKALLYFMKAAEQNNEKAQYEIGYAYEKGRGIEKNEDKAQQWYAISAAQGYQRAKNRLAALNDTYIAPIQTKEDDENYKLKTILKSQIVNEDNLSLGSKKNSSTALINQAQITASYDPIQDIRLQVQVRAVNTIGSAFANDDDFENSMDSNFVELRQASIKKKNLFNAAPLSLEVGRQRFREERSNWWNDDLDAIRLSYDTTLSSAFLAIGQNFSKYRIGTDNNLEKDEQDRLRLFGEASYQYAPQHSAQLRFLYENDYSKKLSINDFVSTNDRDDIDHNLFWSGIRATGDLTAPTYLNIKRLSYHSDIMSLMGTENATSTTRTSANDVRRVNAVNDRDVMAWAFDGRLEAQFDHINSPTLILGYSYASGDDGRGTNTAFRQTGLESNTSLFPEDRATSSLRQYGEVLRPELSNLHILNIGMNFPLFNEGDLNFHYYSYWRDNTSTGLLSNGIDNNLTGNGYHIGQAFDISANYPLDYFFKDRFSKISGSQLRLKMGSFYSGEAYGANQNELALKTTAEVSVKF